MKGRVFLVLALLLSACSSGNNKSSSAFDTTPVAGGTLNVGIVKLASLEPSQAKTLSERVMADYLYDGLTKWSPGTLEAVPAIAERWESSPDQKSWTFYLRQGLKAGNGQEITAADAKLSLEKVAVTPAGTASTDLLSSVAGYLPVRSGQTPQLSGVVVIDAYTLRIDLDVGSAELPSLLGNPALSIVHFNPEGGTSTTGPFVISSQDGERSMTLAKSPGSTAFVDRIIVSFFDDVNGAYNEFVVGKLDWAPVPFDRAAEARGLAGGPTFLPSLRALYLSMNVENPKFADMRYREAITRAIDRAAVSRLLAGGEAQPLAGVVTGAVLGGSEGCGTRCAYDPVASKDLLAQAFPGVAPPPITIDVSAGAPFNEASLKRITDDLASVGISATIRTTAPEEFGSRTVAPDREVFQTSWSGAYPSFGAFLAPLFLSSSTSNVSGLKDAEVDRKILLAQTVTTPGERQTAWQDAERQIFSVWPVIPVAQFPANSVASHRVRGLEPLPTGNFDASTVWLVPEDSE